jgi:hypothetical protein
VIPEKLYFTLYINVILLLTLWYTISSKKETAKEIIRSNDSIIPAAFFCFILIIFIGTRPISYKFGDTPMYAHMYNVIGDLNGADLSQLSEGGFKWLMATCRPFLDTTGFFLVVAAGYIGFMFWACKQLMPNNVLVGVLFNLASFSFYTYGTNGIRNGLACSMVMLGIALMTGNKKERMAGIAVNVAACTIHTSVSLPTMMAIASFYIIKKFKTAYTFWILSIIISLILGNTIANIFASLGFDDRMSGYLNNQDAMDQFSSTGFRWDFLLYSAMPIVLGYYIIIKRGIRNRTYEFLLNTYILSNAFWVMVIRAAFSNRFAYLSWFLYPIVLAYPLLRLPIWKDEQGKYLKQIMIANIGFTYIMWLLGK